MKLPLILVGIVVFMIVSGIQLYFGFYIFQQLNNRMPKDSFGTQGTPTMELFKRETLKIENPILDDRQTGISVWSSNKPAPVRM